MSVELDILNLVPRNAADDASNLRGCIRANNVAQDDALQRSVFVDSAGPRNRLPRRMKIGAETKSRIVMLVIAISSSSAVHCFQRQALTALENAIGDGDVLEAAIRLRAKFDAPGVRNLSPTDRISSMCHRALFRVRRRRSHSSW